MDANLLFVFAKVSAAGFLFGFFASGSPGLFPDALPLSGLLVLVASVLVLAELARLDPASLTYELEASPRPQ